MRVLFNILAALSLLLLVFVLFFWVRSYWAYEGAVRFGRGETVMARVSLAGKSIEQEVENYSSGVISYRGHLLYVSVANPLAPPGNDKWETWSHPAGEALSSGVMVLFAEARGRGGPRYGSAVNATPVRGPGGFNWNLPYTYVSLPYWLLAILLAVLPYRWFARYRDEAAASRCPKCGKDIEDETAEKCPACGAELK